MMMRYACLVLALFGAAPAAADEDARWTGFSLESRLGSSIDPLLAEQTGNHARSSVTLSYTGNRGRLAYGLSLGLADDPLDDKTLRLDGSFIEAAAGPWRLGAGLVERNWAPSRYTSLILSRNARPVPTVYARREAAPIDLPVLRRLGPWQFEIFVGQQEEDRIVPRPLLFGLRSVIEPLPGLELGLTRTAQWGGEGRPSDFAAFWNMLTGQSNVSRTGDQSNDPANQLAGIDVSYRLPADVAPLRLYGQIIGEDEKRYVPVKRMYLFGAEWEGRIAGIESRLTAEYVDTQARRIGFPPRGLAYNNVVYLSGYTQHGRVMGPSMDGDSLATRLMGTHRFDDFSVDWGLGHYRINEARLASHRLSSTRVEGWLANVGVRWNWRGADIAAGLAYRDFDLDNIDSSAGLSGALTLSRKF